MGMDLDELRRTFEESLARYEAIRETIPLELDAQNGSVMQQLNALGQTTSSLGLIITRLLARAADLEARVAHLEAARR